ncbi:MAG: SDR family oxidoreductase [Bacteroidales bacterium]|nr:SDR family oxidoreductase [Bacteroidales bacterium]
MNVLDSFKLDGKIAIVTGGCGHLGHAMVEALSEAGAKIYVAGTNIEKFHRVFGETTAYHFIPINILESQSIQDAFKMVYDKESSIDILVNNAASVTCGGKLPENIDDNMWQSTMEGVAGNVFKCIREVIPFMEDYGGSIINIASMYGVVSPNLSMYEDVCAPYLNPVAYGAGKAAVVQLTKYFGTYLADKNIRVNCISPGTFPSPTVQENKEFVRRLSEKNPARRIGAPEDIKGTVLFLASDASRYIIGQNIMVDGGWTIW